MLTRVQLASAAVLALASVVVILWMTGGTELHHTEPPEHGPRFTAPPKAVGAHPLRSPDPDISRTQVATKVASGEAQASRIAAPDGGVSGVSTGADGTGRDHPDESHRPGKVIPHPLDETRVRDMEQRQLLAEVEAAIEGESYERARSLLAQHDRSFDEHEAWSDRREAYQLIADCKQYPSVESRASGQRFVAQQRGSTLRRSVRRACLDAR